MKDFDLFEDDGAVFELSNDDLGYLTIENGEDIQVSMAFSFSKETADDAIAFIDRALANLKELRDSVAEAK